jgi:hypothetical protein
VLVMAKYQLEQSDRGGVQAAKRDVDANVLTEDNYLLRECEHGVRHPVGHLRSAQFASYLAMAGSPDSGVAASANRHESVGPNGGAVRVLCDGCCEAFKKMDMQ